MNWLSIIIFLAIALISLIQKAAKENRDSEKTRPLRPPQTGGPAPLPPWFQAGQVVQTAPTQASTEGEGQSLESALSSIFEGEGEGAGEEGTTLEGSWLDVPQEQGDLDLQNREFQTEAANQTNDEDAIHAKPGVPSGDNFSLDWEDSFALDTDDIQDNERRAPSRIGRDWLSTREDLIRAVLASEVLGRPGGWRQRRPVCQRL